MAGRFAVIVHDAAQASLEGRLTIVEQQADGHFQQAKISQNLLAMYIDYSLGRFEFNQQTVFDDNVCPQGVVDYNIFESERHRNFTRNRKPPIDQCSFKNFLIH